MPDFPGALSCGLLADDPGGVEVIVGAFFLTAESLGQALLAGSVADTIEAKYDNAVNPKNKKGIKTPDVPISTFGGENGKAGGQLITFLTKEEARLISDRGATLIGKIRKTKGLADLVSDNGAAFISEHGGALVGLDGASLVGLDGASLVGLDGASLVGLDGASLKFDASGNLVGLDGASRPSHAKRSAKPERKGTKYKAVSLGSYRAELSGSGNVQVNFELSKDGKTIIETLGKENLELKKGVIPLNATLISQILPADGQGAGGSFEDIKIK